MINVTEEIGRYFGYPECCIREYNIILGKRGKRSPEQLLVLSKHPGNGFVPCTAHARQILLGTITIEKLIHNRICPLPYPNEPDIEVIDEYLTQNA